MGRNRRLTSKEEKYQRPEGTSKGDCPREEMSEVKCREEISYTHMIVVIGLLAS